MNFRNATIDIEALSPREREAWEHRTAGRTADEAAALMGCHRNNVHSLWYHARNRKEPATITMPRQRGKMDDRELSTLGRCKCGLLNPCHGCGPTARELAESRNGDGEARLALAGGPR
jgi:DNA-binding CsgD family transcriptional regulator